jgi:hypothetical protein
MSPHVNEALLAIIDPGVPEVGDALVWDGDKYVATTISESYASLASLAADPDLLIVGTITRDGNGAATAADVEWPDGTEGAYTATTVSTAFPGAVDAYTVTYGDPATRTFTQPAVTRDANGAVTVRPAIVES